MERSHPHTPSNTHTCVCTNTSTHLQESGLECVCVNGEGGEGVLGVLLLACKSSEMFANRICLCLLECLTEIYIHI